MQKRVTTILATLLGVGAILAMNVPEAAPEMRRIPMVEAFEGAAPAKMAKPAPRMNDVSSDWSGRKFYGALIFSNDWSSMSITAVPYGVYQFKIGANAITNEALYTGMSYDFLSGARQRDDFYGVRAISMFGSLTGVCYHDISLSTLSERRQNMLDRSVTYSDLASVMCYDPSTDNIYAVIYNSDLTGLLWGRFDSEKMELETISQFNGKFNVLALASDPKGVIYCISSDGDLYTVNKSNGRVSLVGSTGVQPAAYSQSACWDSKTGTLLWTSVTPYGSRLYSVDPETAEASLVGKFNNGEQIVGIYTDGTEVAPAAPNMAEEMSIEFNNPGSLDGNVKFRIPATCGDGAALGSDVTMTVWLDGETLKEDEAVSAGEEISIPVTLENGNHYASVVLSKGEEMSPVAYTYQWAGYDYPEPVSDLTLSVANGVSSVSWEAPAKGVNNGYIDAQAMRYDVYRLPDNVMVAEKTSATEFSETLPSTVKKYSYRVIPFNSDKEGEGAESNPVIYGKALEVPYTQSLEDASAFDIYTVHDLDGDGRGWRYVDYNKEIECDVTYSKPENNDWLVTPSIHMEEGKVYRLSLDMRTYSPSYKEHLKFWLGNGLQASDLDNYTEVADWNDLSMDKGFEVRTVDFKPATTGDYNIGIQYLGVQNQSSLVRIRGLKIELIGSAAAPDAVGGLAVVPDADGALKAEIRATAPTKRIDGRDITSAMTMLVYRDGNPQAVASGEAQPGEEVTLSDENVNFVGFHTYRVVASNEEGEGMPAEAEAFVGVYTAPWSNSMSTASEIREFTCITPGWSNENNESPMSYSAYENAMEIYHFNITQDSHKIFVMFPTIKMDSESVYRISLDYKSSGYGKVDGQSIRLGDAPTAEAQTEVVAELPASTSLQYETVEADMAVIDGGNKTLSFFIESKGQWDMVSCALRNASLSYLTSAKAPGCVTDFSATPDANGGFKVQLAFNAPTLDYAGRELSEITNVCVYRGESGVPAKVFENVQPGDRLEWNDEGATASTNTYRIIASNSFGGGKEFSEDVYVGFDTPRPVGDIALVPSRDNLSVDISWTAPETGVNNGLINKEELTYSVYRLRPDDPVEANRIALVADKVKECSYTTDPDPEAAQELCYFGVSAVTPEGESEMTPYFTILGKLYPLPFAESFANGEAKTQSWVVPTNDNSLQSGFTSGEAMADFGIEPEDGDNGAFFFYNGNATEYPSQILVFTPKVDTQGAEKLKLSFWAYQGNQSGAYASNPTLEITVSDDETLFHLVGKVVWNETTPGWKHYEFDLPDFSDPNGGVFLQMVATLSGYQDIMFIDNILISDPSGVNTLSKEESIGIFGVKGGLLTRGAAGKKVEVFTADGKRCGSFTATDSFHVLPAGVYVVKIENRSRKIMITE